MPEPTEEQKRTWLDGYRAATQTAGSFEVHIAGELDETLNAGAQMVASLLKTQMKKLEEADMANGTGGGTGC